VFMDANQKFFGLLGRVGAYCGHSPAYAGSHGCEAVEEGERVSSEALAKEDPLRRGVAEVNKGATAVKPWGST
jgi:hypothetical protein